MPGEWQSRAAEDAGERADCALEKRNNMMAFHNSVLSSGTSACFRTRHCAMPTRVSFNERFWNASIHFSVRDSSRINQAGAGDRHARDIKKARRR